MKLATALLALTVSAPTLAAAGQLPRTVMPMVYDITVKPDAKALTFTGTESVTVNMTAPTTTIVLNAAELAITKVMFDGVVAPFKLDATGQTLTVTLPIAGRVAQHVMTFDWTGTIGRSAAGLFAIDYTNTDGSQARMLATQFEASDARRFAPMWDEPAFKAKFRLTTTAPAGQIAFSNMAASAVTKHLDGTQVYSFAETPVMSSYLLFMGQGSMERKTLAAGKTELGVIARKGVTDQGDYALAQAKRLLPYYNAYFGQPYPLPKMDMIAGPGSSQFFGAMENWGAIFYFENELLFDPARTTESGRQRIFTVVAHEMAHQWFGDLVTMAWWDDIWLNEGFASWMESKTSADLNPTWKAEASAVAFARERAMDIDATAATHPIVKHVETVDQIGEAFDAITYQKGEAVIRMLESTLGSDAFRKGIRSYMAKYRSGNAVTDQLWTELSTAAGQPVTTIAHDFTLQGGVPLVTMTGMRCERGRTVATLTQGRFGLDPVSRVAQNWHVPLVLATLAGRAGAGGETSAIVSGAVPAQFTVRGCGTLLLNRGKGSYTRVMYDDAGHAAIVRDYARLGLNDRLGTLGDDYALAQGGYQPLGRYLAVLGKVGVEADPLEWSLVTDELGGLTGFYAGTPIEPRLRARVQAVLSPVLTRVGLTAQAGESPLVTNLREALIGRLGANGDPVVAGEARRYVALLASDPTAIPPAVRTPILSTYAINATPAEWDALLGLTKAEKSPVAKNRFVSLLGAARDPALAQRALDLLTTGTITTPQKAALLRSVSARHADMAFDWAVANAALVDTFVEGSNRSGFVVSLGGGSTDPRMPAKIEAYAEKNLPATSRGGAQRTLAGMAVRKASAERLRAAVAAWVG